MGIAAPVLEIATDRDPDRWVPIVALDFVISSKSPCDFLVRSGKRKITCRIFEREGRLLIEDQKSSGGLWRGQKKLKSSELLADGDRLRVAGIELRFRACSLDQVFPPLTADSEEATAALDSTLVDLLALRSHDTDEAVAELLPEPPAELSLAKWADLLPAPEPLAAPFVESPPVPEAVVAPFVGSPPALEAVVAPFVESPPAPEAVVAPLVESPPAPEPIVAPFVEPALDLPSDFDLPQLSPVPLDQRPTQRPPARRPTIPASSLFARELIAPAVTARSETALWLSFAPGAWTVLDRDELWVGRSLECHLRIPGSSVSRKHAVIRRERETFSIESTGSLGIIRRGEKLPAGRHEILDGDEFALAERWLACSIRDKEHGPPLDAGQFPLLLDRRGRAYRLASAVVTIGTAAASDLVLKEPGRIDLKLRLARRDGSWVGYLVDRTVLPDAQPVPADQPLDRVPGRIPPAMQLRIVADSEEFRAGTRHFRLVLPRYPGLRRKRSMALRVNHRDQIVAVDKDEFVIGRSQTCDLRIPSGEVSRRACVVKRSGDDYYLEPLSSTGGVWSELEQISSPRRIKDGDVFRIGPERLRFEFRPKP